MRLWHRWRHGPPTFGIFYPPRRDWRPRMSVSRDIICSCGRYWPDQYTVYHRKW